MKQEFSDISSAINQQIELANQDEKSYINMYEDNFTYVDSPNLSNDDRLKFRVDILSGTVTLGTLNSVYGEEVAVPLASISGNYYSNMQKIENLLNNPQRTFLKNLRYIVKSGDSYIVDGSKHILLYDTIVPNNTIYEKWF